MKKRELPETRAMWMDGKLFSRDTESEERLKRLFEPDILIRHDYELTHRKRVWSPEEELIAAVLEQAVADFQRYAFFQDKKNRRHFLDVEQWISDDSNDRVCSFTNCCAVLGIEPGYLRRGLARWKETRSVKKVFHVAA